VEAYLEYLQLPSRTSPESHLSLQTAVCIILYTLCKVRGYKVIVGFFTNEPRYFESILGALEQTLSESDNDASQPEWQVSYVLLLWLSHLLLTPFDLASISAAKPQKLKVEGLNLPPNLPPLAIRVIQVGMGYLYSSTKAQDAAAAMLVRLATRPDMQKLRLADDIVTRTLSQVQSTSSDILVTIYEKLGPLRLLTGIATSADLGHLVPGIYKACEKLANEDESSVVASNAVAKKMMVKIFRNIAILSLRSASTQGPLLSFLESTSVLEDVIDYLLRSLGDRDTPVRYAAAKAISLIVLDLDPEMGHEIIQAVLDTFKEDMPKSGDAFDVRSVNPLKWHGLTLALAHVLFKRTASPEQLPDIVSALVSALQFEQRTATGSSIGTNVRDAANFGIWSMSRRYTTDELLSVSTITLRFVSAQSAKHTSVIQMIAVQLILSACLDPAGNIRRGSSAALQELIGRHPNQVHNGIALVQIVEYQAVGLRRRAMVDVANHAAESHQMYWQALVVGLLGWRGLGSADVSSREASADSLAKLSRSEHADTGSAVLDKVLQHLQQCSSSDAEALHGLILSLAHIIEHSLASHHDVAASGGLGGCWNIVPRLPDYIAKLSPRVLRSELPSAASLLLTALCHAALRASSDAVQPTEPPADTMETTLERLLARHEDTILQTIPSLARAILALKRKAGVPLGCIGAHTLCKKVSMDGSKSILQGFGRAVALGALAVSYEPGLSGEKASSAVTTLTGLMDAMSVDWRVIGVRALQLAVNAVEDDQHADPGIMDNIAGAVDRGLCDYTVDERGDVGSLVRLQAIACASTIFEKVPLHNGRESIQVLRTDIARLSLEKLDRVRFAAAQCRRAYLGFVRPVTNNASVSTYEYFYDAVSSLRAEERDPALETALLEGCISCAGVSAESLLQASRAALVDTLCGIDDALLLAHLSAFAAVLKGMLTESTNIHSALELLAFLLDMQIPQRLAKHVDFKWRNLLSTVQKAHHKSNDIPKIVAAVHVYQRLADVPSIRSEVLKKLISMLRTNPYPRIRMSVAETFFIVTGDESLRGQNWTAPIAQNKDVVAKLEQEYVSP